MGGGGGGQENFYPYEKGGGGAENAEGGGGIKFWDSFSAEARSFSHTEGGGAKCFHP